MSENLDRLFETLFSCLKAAGYAWTPLSPDILMQCRKTPETFSPLVRFFGLGLDLSDRELEEEGIPSRLIPELRKLRPAVSRFDDLFVPHSHWASSTHSSKGYVYLGEESAILIESIRESIEDERSSLGGKRVLDLGSGAGALSFFLAGSAARILGLESSAEAVRWSQAAACAQGLKNVHFARVSIGAATIGGACPEAEGEWDAAVFNPPMAIPEKGASRPHRDGGELGIEIPLLFLEFARSRLKPGGLVYCVATNPIVQGRSALFERIDTAHWQFEERKRLHERFNQSLYRQEGYRERGIQRVELWFLKLSRR